MSYTSTISFRESIRWIPEPASEPTDTVVLTGGKSGVFLDIRFYKNSNELDWAFAGYRSTERLDEKQVTKFEHKIDSRTENPSEVEDYGVNTELEDGTTLETGDMVNPATRKMTAYEEVWKDESPASTNSLFMRNMAGTVLSMHQSC